MQVSNIISEQIANCSARVLVTATEVLLRALSKEALTR